MLKKTLLALVANWLLISGLQAKEISGVELPDRMTVENQELMLNGAGVRTKFFLDMYVAGLYLPAKTDQAQAIIDQDQPMVIRLVITSSLISAKKMSNATREGFEKSTAGNTAPIQAEIDRFIEAFKEEIKKGDRYDLIYQPGKGVTVIKNDKPGPVIAGLPFKRALFGIWLSDDPVQDDLKAGMLGQE